MFFKLHFKNVLQKISKYKWPWIDLFIMTSSKTNKEIVNFLDKHDYFGYNKSHIHFFQQEECAVTDAHGKLLIDNDYRIMTSPDGNGNCIQTLLKVFPDKVKDKQWINIVAIDNVLQNIADPHFLGYVVLKNAGAGAKAVRKSSASENVGVICMDGNTYKVIEYYEIPEKIKVKPGLDYGVTLNYIFSLEEFKEKKIHLPLHSVKREVKINDKLVSAFKDEFLITDLIEKYEKCIVFEVERSKEFAPIKNKEGNDSINTAQHKLIDLNFDI